MILNNRFEIIKEIGAGGMGKVYLAKDLKLKRNVAIKIITDTAISDSSSKARFLREAQTASSLDHSNICTIYEIYNEEQEEYIVMQYIDGITIDQIIKIKKLSINKILDIAIQICDGMIEAHSKGVIHRDIKPSNIIIDKKGIVKILDFGLAKFDNSGGLTSNNTNITEQGIVLGTVSYMSPEQAQGETLDKRSDIFSFGTVLFEMIDGYNPFLSEHKIETLYNVTSKGINFKRDISDELKKLINKILEKKKKNRYNSFEEVKEALAQIKNNVYEKSMNEDFANIDSSHTELLNTDDSLNLLKIKTSDNEQLGDIVNRIRKYKRSTEAVSSGNFIQSKKKYLIIFAIILTLTVIVFFVFNTNKPKIIPIKKTIPKTLKQKTYLKLKLFLNLTENKQNELPEKINYLLIEFLNQSNKLPTISEKTLNEIKKNGNNKLYKNFKYELTGKVSSKNDIYTIDAELISIKNKKIIKRFTKTGLGKNSLISNQIDSLALELSKYLIYKNQNIPKIEFKKISKIYGRNWSDFEEFYRGLLLYKKLDINRSIKVFEKIKNNPIAEYYLANLYYFNGDKKKAKKIINKIIPFTTNMTEVIRDRIFAFKAQLDHDFTKQIQYLRNLKNKFPFSKEIFYEIGEAYFHHGKALKAIENYKKALLLDKNYSQAINHLGYCYSYLGEHDKALEQFQLYRTKDNLSPNSLDSLGDGYFYRGKYEDSLSMKNSAVKLDPEGVSWAYLTIADILILQSKYDLAIDKLDKYINVLISKNMIKSRDRAVVLTKEAYIFYLQKKYKKANELIKQSIKLFDSNDIIDNNAETHWLSGLIAIETRDSKKAKHELNWLKSIVEKYKISKNNYYEPYKYFLHLRSLILEQDGNLIDAEQEYKKLISMKTQLSYWITYFNYQFFHNEYIKYLIRNARYSSASDEIAICLAYSDLYIPTLKQKDFLIKKIKQEEN